MIMIDYPTRLCYNSFMRSQNEKKEMRYNDIH